MFPWVCLRSSRRGLSLSPALTGRERVNSSVLYDRELNSPSVGFHPPGSSSGQTVFGDVLISFSSDAGKAERAPKIHTARRKQRHTHTRTHTHTHRHTHVHTHTDTYSFEHNVTFHPEISSGCSTKSDENTTQATEKELCLTTPRVQEIRRDKQPARRASPRHGRYALLNWG